jgi:hypothetical protein
MGRRSSSAYSGVVAVSGVATLSDALRARLQLSLGSIAELGAELTVGSDRRTFAAISRADGKRATVTLHSAPPLGPDPAALVQRLTQIRALHHAAIDLPIASGELDGCAWVLEAIPVLPSAEDRLTGRPVSIAHAVSAIRDLARALTAMHRAGVAHGAIDLHTVTIGPDSARLGGLAASHSGSPQGDLDALGLVAWALFTGEVHEPAICPLSQIRRGVPKQLDALCAAWLGTNVARHPRRAEAILDVLDAIPTRRLRTPGWIGDVVTRDGRPRPHGGWLLLAVGALVLIVMLALRG